MANTEKLQEIFEAVDKIVTSRISKNDTTSRCKIIKADKASQGEYTVDDGSRKFVVYSDNKTYQVDDEVFVFIPGDDDNQEYKYIIGKCVKSDSPYYTYKNPLENYVDMTGNLFSSANTKFGEVGLIANGKTEEIFLGSINCDFTGYDRLVIQADMKTWLASFGYIGGNYGLRLEVTDRTKPTITSTVDKYKLYTLDSNQMYADPYNYQTYYTQQEIFDISGLENVVKISLTFYQKKNFKDEDGNYPTTDIDGASNIFVNNFKVSLGYDLENFDSDKVLLTTPQSLTYSPYLTEAMQVSLDEEDKQAYSQRNMQNTIDLCNAKDVRLRWVHKEDDDTLISITEDDERMERSIIHWYRYNLIPDLSDPLAGAFWEEQEDLQNKFELLGFVPDNTVASDKLKAIVEVMPEDMDEARYRSIDIETAVDEEEIQFYELYSASIETYYSDELVFTNEGYVPDYTTVDLINGLSIEADIDGYNGVYHLYNTDGSINAKSESNKKRVLTATYSSLISGITELDTAEQITWIIPTINTMITQPAEGIEYDSIHDKVKQFEDRIEITREGIVSSTTPGTEEADSAQQYFRIKSYYTQAATNNTIICRLTKNNRTYEAQIQLAFGVSGTSGTDYTFTIEFVNGENALEAQDGMKAIVKPVIYDANNNDVTNSGYFTISDWSWYSQGNGGVACAEMSDGTCVLQVKTNDISKCHNYILQCSATGTITFAHENGEGTEKSVKLKAYLAIPVKKAGLKYLTMNGSDSIRYNTSGTSPIFYNDTYTLYNYNAQTAQTSQLNATWEMWFGADCAEAYGAGYKFYPQVSSGGKLTVPSLYLQGTGKQISVIGKVNGEVYWTQPLRVFIDAYGSPLLNAWDGNLTFDEKNGTILSTMVGAGVKDSENRFNGVLMGDVKIQAAYDGATINSGYYTGIGLYGYHEGIQSFGLNISGKAFFGKAGRGQILIDGNTGVIQSAEYQRSSNGMKIDLDNGILTSKRGNALIEIDPTHTSGAYFKIRSDNNNTLMYVGDSNYYLQSDNFATDSTGMKINLADGTLEARQGYGKVKITGGGSPYFEIYSVSNNPLMYVSNSGYYLRSDNFATNQGLNIDLANGTFELRQAAGKVLMTGNGSPYFQITDTSGNNLMYIANGSYYIQSSGYVAPASQGAPTGVKIDLGTGNIYAEKGYIGAWILDKDKLSSSNGRIILNAITGIINCKNKDEDLLFEADSSKSIFKIGPWNFDKTAIWSGTTKNEAKTIIEPDGNIQLKSKFMQMTFSDYTFNVQGIDNNSSGYPYLSLSRVGLMISIKSGYNLFFTSGGFSASAQDVKLSVSSGWEVAGPGGDEYIEGKGIVLKVGSGLINVYEDSMFIGFGKTSESDYHGMFSSSYATAMRCGSYCIKVDSSGGYLNNELIATREWCQSQFDQISQSLIGLADKIGNLQTPTPGGTVTNPG